MNLNCEESLLKKTGLDYEVLDSGCCGMAGYFGYEKGDHYKVSIKAGERVLLPAVRSFDSNGFIIADGFSCREQIEQSTNRKGLHLAQVLDMGLQHKSYFEPNPERDYLKKNKLKATSKQKIRRALVAGAALATITVLLTRLRVSNKNK